MPQSPRAKIVCTLGPASNSVGVLRDMIEAGLNVARLNFSHGTHETHRQVIAALREASAQTGRMVGILGDLQGPRLRVGTFAGGQATLERGATFTITAREVEGTAEVVSSTYAGLPGDVAAGHTILLDDGLIKLEVVSVQGPDVVCRVVVGGVLRDNKGINIPGAALSVDAVSPKDLADADFAIAEGLDYLAMSFVRHPDEVRRMREYLTRKGSDLPICAKIEKPQALEHITEIIAVSDAIMVARGDLGVELPTEEVPAIQKNLIARCNRVGKPVITATQMLESMIQNPRPTRAEASDVANAILDGTDAVMLSGESASGRYPVEAVAVMRRIIVATEATKPLGLTLRRRSGEMPMAIHEGIAASACGVAERVEARGLAPITLSGSMARQLAKNRPATAIFAVSQFEHVLRRLCLVWGVEGLPMPDLTMQIDEACMEVQKRLVGLGHLREGDRLVITAGLPFSERQATNMVRVDVVR